MDNKDNREKKGDTCWMFVFIILFAWLLLAIMYFPSLKDPEIEYPQGSTDDCIRYTKYYICFDYCGCKWKNDTGDCLGRDWGDLDVIPKKCNDTIESRKQSIIDDKHIKKIFFIVGNAILCFMSCIIYGIYIKDKYNKSRDNVNTDNNIRTSFLSKILPCIKFWSNRGNT
jgi:hypothetical protein